MREILNGIHTWAWFSELKGFDFNGWLVVSEHGNLMIDPPPLTSDDEARLDHIGAPGHIVLTNRDHEREVGTYRRRWGAQTWMHELDVPLAEFQVDHIFRHGDRLPADIEVIHIPHNKSPGECALLVHRDPNVLILGDALIGNPPGRLNLLPPDKYADAAKAREGIRVLLHYEYGPILTSDGASILENGRAAIEAFLKG